MSPASGADSLLYNLQVEGYDRLSELDIANMINFAFLKPMDSFQRLDFPPCYHDDPTPLTIPEPAVLTSLAKLNPRKAAGLMGYPAGF